MEFHEASHLIYSNLSTCSPGVFAHILPPEGDDILFSGLVESFHTYIELDCYICAFVLIGSEAHCQMNGQIFDNSLLYSERSPFYLKIHDYKLPMHLGGYNIENNLIEVSTLSYQPSYIPSHRKVSFDCFFVSTDFGENGREIVKAPESILTRWEILDIR